MPSKYSVVVTGANRGIGLSFSKFYSQRGNDVYAVCRTVSDELRSLGVNIIDGVDVSSEADVVSLKDRLKSVEIDLLINNAGVLHNEVLGKIDFTSIEKQFRINALGPLRVTESLVENLSRDAKIAMITSRMGSITDNTSGGRYGYRMSKAALNIASVSLSHDLASRGIAVGIFHPGLVATDMIGGHGDITPDQAAERLAERIENLTMKNSGSFWHSNGEVLPW
jgi:NAD(P)-dependent dehydrogenase (short-subunit alcohol dehydrogenase family)